MKRVNINIFCVLFCGKGCSCGEGNSGGGGEGGGRWECQPRDFPLFPNPFHWRNHFPPKIIIPERLFWGEPYNVNRTKPFQQQR